MTNREGVLTSLPGGVALVLGGEGVVYLLLVPLHLLFLPFPKSSLLIYDSDGARFSCCLGSGLLTVKWGHG